MKLKLAVITAATLCTQMVFAADPASCKAVRFADVGWSDIAATTGLASVVLEGLATSPQ